MMTSGVEWREDGSYNSQDSWVQMAGSDDPVSFFLDKPVSDAPGSRFYYNTGGSHILSAILREAAGRTAEDLAKEYIFGPLGIQDVQWNADKTGTSVGGAGAPT